jgi:hypothetical protein
MSKMPMGMSENENAFQPREIEEAEEGHHHGPNCGHEAVEHDGHIDYIEGKHRHWWNKDHWAKH